MFHASGNTVVAVTKLWGPCILYMQALAHLTLTVGHSRKVLALFPSHIEGSCSARGEVSAVQVSRFYLEELGFEP